MLITNWCFLQTGQLHILLVIHAYLPPWCLQVTKKSGFISHNRIQIMKQAVIVASAVPSNP